MIFIEGKTNRGRSIVKYNNYKYFKRLENILKSKVI